MATIKTFLEKKQAGVPLTMITAYDNLGASWACAAGIDSILVGDSLGNIVQGKGTTLAVTLEQTTYHTEIVQRVVNQRCADMKSRPLVIADMPFPFGHTGIEKAVEQAADVVKKTGCGAIKVETSAEDAPLIHALVRAGVPVMAHIGLKPQQILNLGKYSIQRAKEILLEDAHAVEDAGAFGVVLECVEPTIAKQISVELRIPTIGIGSGPDCDGQVQVISDVLGLDTGFVPKHAKQYAQLGVLAIDALKQYVDGVVNKNN